MQVRADDTTHLKSDWTGFFFLNPAIQSFKPTIVPGISKSELGFNHLDTARALVPIKLLEEVTSLECQYALSVVSSVHTESLLIGFSLISRMAGGQ